MTAESIPWIQSSASHEPARPEVEVRHELADPAWDAFLSQMECGSYTQSSLWAQLKTTARWKVCRIIVRRDDRIVAGAQMLIRGMPFLGGLGYVSRGPVLVDDDPQLMSTVLDALLNTARRMHLHYLLVLPPYGQPRCAHLLESRGFRPSRVEPAPTATVLLDLTKSLDELLAGMKEKTRYNIRLGLRKGIAVRIGTENDLETFHGMLQATGRRKGFSVPSLDYYRELWRLFAPGGRVQLFVAEASGKPISGLLAVAFGDTVTYWRGGWTGECGQLHPNEAVHWKAIAWAKEQGFRWYDLDGIVPFQVEGTMGRADTTFKLGFGGEQRTLPGAFEHIRNPVLRGISGLFLSNGARRLRGIIAAAFRGHRALGCALVGDASLALGEAYLTLGDAYSSMATA
jgi:lipid II:glycine glycyltransferase (peptidoglycan interpeptide bridge formation enzyme)